MTGDGCLLMKRVSLQLRLTDSLSVDSARSRGSQVALTAATQRAGCVRRSEGMVVTRVQGHFSATQAHRSGQFDSFVNVWVIRGRV
jgi:hypothetical protein